MRNAILMMLLVVSGSAAAEWLPYGDSPARGGYHIYADPSSIVRSGDTVKMLDLVDFKTSQINRRNSKPYLSAKSQREYNCKEERYRTLSFTWHSGHMSGGDVVYTDNEPDRWSPVPPESGRGSLWKVACGKQ